MAVVEPRFEPSPDRHEVFEVPLSFFLDPANHKRYSRPFEGRDRHFYAMPYGKHCIRGATAGMLINLFEFLTRQ